MGYNDRYWTNKNERAKNATKHIKEMQDKFSVEIQHSIDKSKIYDDTNIKTFSSENVPTNTIENLDSVSAAFKYNSGKTAILNFASYKNPGGGYVNGSSAQEESLCEESFLYNVLRNFNKFYEYNNSHLNRALYTNRAIYSPDVVFEHDGKTLNLDVITCAAPNRSTYIRYNVPAKDKISDFVGNETAEKVNTDILRDRIRFIKNIAEEQGVETLILGAFGCGVFRQDAATVAKMFKEEFATSNVKTIIHPVPADVDKSNYEAFKKVFDGRAIEANEER